MVNEARKATLILSTIVAIGCTATVAAKMGEANDKFKNDAEAIFGANSVSLSFNPNESGFATPTKNIIRIGAAELIASGQNSFERNGVTYSYVNPENLQRKKTLTYIHAARPDMKPVQVGYFTSDGQLIIH